MIYLIIGLAFSSVIATGIAARLFFFAEDDRRAAETRRRLKDVGPTGNGGPEVGLTLMRDKSLSTIPLLDRLLNLMPRVSSLQRMLSQAGSPLNVGSLLLTMSLIFAVTMALGFLYGRPLIGVTAAPLAGLLPLFWLRKMRAARLKSFEAQFPEAVGMMARAIRAGHSMSSAMGMVSEEMDDPVAGEFGRVVEDYSFGKSMPDAMTSLVDRVGLQDVKFFVTAVLLQRETGGNLAEILDNMGDIIRQRFQLVRQVKTLSAEGRLSGVILSVMTPALVGFLWFLSPDYLDTLINTPRGQMLLAVGAGCQLLGMLTIKKLVHLEV